MTPGKIVDLRNLGFRNFVRINTTHPLTACMNMKHYLGCFLTAHAEEMLQDLNDELHRSIVVVQENDFVKTRLLKLGTRLFYSKATILT